MEANRAGYDEALLLTEDGYVADGSGENVFIVRDGVIFTPGPLRVDPARDHARLDHPDRARPRAPGRHEKPLIRTDLYAATRSS